jgi:excisionase family DNA binding protein
VSLGRYLTQNQLAEYLNVGRDMIPVLIKDGRVPEPIALWDSPRGRRWDRERVDAFLAEPLDAARVRRSRPVYHPNSTATDITRSIANAIRSKRAPACR